MFGHWQQLWAALVQYSMLQRSQHACTCIAPCAAFNPTLGGLSVSCKGSCCQRAHRRHLKDPNKGATHSGHAGRCEWANSSCGCTGGGRSHQGPHSHPPNLHQQHNMQSTARQGWTADCKLLMNAQASWLCDKATTAQQPLGTA